MVRIRSSTRDLMALGCAVGCGIAAVSCAALTSAGTQAPMPAGAPAIQANDTTGLIPAGYGSLHQDDIAIRVTHLGLGVRAIPLDESFIRTLASDAYRSLVAIRDSKKAQLDSVARRSGLTSLTVWLVSFSNTQQGEARFAPGDVNLTTAGRDFAPLAVIGLSPNFGDQRVRQGERVDALMAFDGAVNPNQPLSLRFETETGGDWQTVLQRVEGERSRIRSRAGGRAPLGDRPW